MFLILSVTALTYDNSLCFLDYNHFAIIIIIITVIIMIIPIIFNYSTVNEDFYAQGADAKVPNLGKVKSTVVQKLLLLFLLLLTSLQLYLFFFFILNVSFR